MGLAWSDVLLLTTRRDFDVALTEDTDIADDGANAAVEQAEGEVFIAEQAALVAGFGRDPQNASAAQAVHAMGQADAVIFRTGIESEDNGNFLTLLQGFAGRLMSGHDENLDLTQTKRVVGILGGNRKDFLYGLQNHGGDEGRAISALLDLAAKEVVTRLGVQAFLPQFFFDNFGPNHERHLRKAG